MFPSLYDMLLKNVTHLIRLEVCKFTLYSVVIIAIQLTATLPVLGLKSKVQLEKIDDCKASLNGQLINLEPLSRVDGQPRFEVEFEGWRYSYNPCLSYNLPENPHDGRGDGCHYVTMCKWQNTGDSYGQYYTLGIERTTKFQIRRPGVGRTNKRNQLLKTIKDKIKKAPSDAINRKVIENQSRTSSNNSPSSDTLINLELYANDRSEYLKDDDTDNRNNNISSLQFEVEESSEDSSETSSEQEGSAFIENSSSEGLNETSSEQEGSAYIDGSSSEETNETSSDNSVDEEAEVDLLASQENNTRTGESRIISNRDSKYLNKRSISAPKYSLLYKYMVRNINRQYAIRRKRNTNEHNEDPEKDEEEFDEDDDEDDGDSSSDSDEDEDEEEEEESVGDEENKSLTEVDVILKLRGIRKMKQRRSLIYLICDMKRKAVAEALFLLRQIEDKDVIFELHHKCCCPGECEHGLEYATTNATDSLSANDQRLKELEEAGPKFMWLILVANAAIILIAILIGTTFCRKGGSYGPYNTLPVILSSSRNTINSLESLRAFKPRIPRKLKAPARAAEYFEYSSSLLKKEQLPMLDNVAIPARDLDIGQRLGGGLFGDTYLAVWNERNVAVKRITVGIHQNQITPEEMDWMIKETTFLSRHRHKNTVSMLGICFELRQPHIINEYVEGESLKDLLIKAGETISMIRRVKMLQQAVEGLQFLHSVKSRPILHRDLRCANLLVTDQDKIKVADFGVIKLTQKLREECTKPGCFCQSERSGTPASVRWTAPEILDCPNAMEGLHSAVTTACDVFSFAMVLWEVATTQDPFYEIDFEDKVRKIILSGGRPDVDGIEIIPHYRELMKICWDQDPVNRPSFKQISNHLKNVCSNCVKQSVKIDKANRPSDSTTAFYLRSALNHN